MTTLGLILLLVYIGVAIPFGRGAGAHVYHDDGKPRDYSEFKPGNPWTALMVAVVWGIMWPLVVGLGLLILLGKWIGSDHDKLGRVLFGKGSK